MLKRLWLLLSTVWAALVFAVVSPDRYHDGILWIAAVPFVAGVAFFYAARYVLFGRVR